MTAELPLERRADVFGNVARRPHPHERAAHAWKRAHECNGSLRIVRERGERIVDGGRQATRQATLHERRTRDDRDAKLRRGVK